MKASQLAAQSRRHKDPEDRRQAPDLKLTNSNLTRYKGTRIARTEMLNL